MLTSPDQIVAWLRRWTGCCGLLLLGGTYRLWIDGQDFPQVPFLEAWGACPTGVEWIAMAALCMSLAAMALDRGPGALFNGIAFISAALLIGLDQQRLQPWMLQLLIFFLLFSLSERSRALGLLRFVVISIYAYSALGKLDFQFLHTVGLDLLQGVGGFAGIDTSRWSMTTRVQSAALFPIVELLIAVGLAVPRLRRIAGALACALHIGLVLLFSPLGLGHSAGVILWNVQFAFQAILLFVVVEKPFAAKELRKNNLGVSKVAITLRRDDSQATQPSYFSADPKPLEVVEDSQDASRRTPAFARLATLIVGLTILLPLTERFGLWDHWPSWALYAPHSSRVEVQVASTALDRLPTQLRQLVDKASEKGVEQLWYGVPLDRWCLQATTTPIYPQSRFQLGIARSLAEQMHSEFEIRIAVLGVANRFTGKRSVRYFEGETAITGAGELFWLNTAPRRK